MTDATRKKTTTRKPAAGKSLVASTALTPNLKKILVVFVVVLVLLTAAMLYVLYAVTQTDRSTVEQERAVAQKMETLDSRIQSLENKLTESAAVTDELSQSQQDLADSLQALQKERPDSDQDWTIREVEYLVLIAMRRLHLERDINTAYTALQTADQRLHDLEDPALNPIREQLAADMNALQNVEQPDIEGMAAYLTDLIKRIETLPTKNIIMDDQGSIAVSDEADAKTDQKNWRDLPKMVWHELKSLVVIKRTDNAGTAFIMPNEEYYLYQNLKLELANSRLALLRRDSETFARSIDLAQLWLSSYFNQDAAAIENILAALKKMQGLELKPTLPDISRSLQTVRDFIKINQTRG